MHTHTHTQTSSKTHTQNPHTHSNPFSEVNLSEDELLFGAANVLECRLDPAASETAPFLSVSKRKKQQKGNPQLQAAMEKRRRFLDASSSLLTPLLPLPQASRQRPSENGDSDEEQEEEPREPLCVLPGGCVNLPVSGGLSAT